MNWFNSDYYHILYKNRDKKEAEFFINNLIKKLKIKKGSKILDLACGVGRHSFYLNKKGMNVIGIDNSENNINNAKKIETTTTGVTVTGTAATDTLSTTNLTLGGTSITASFKETANVAGAAATDRAAMEIALVFAF